MTISFAYNKGQVIQALRYHFLARPEIRFMIILVNVFAFSSAALYYFKKVTPFAFLLGSSLWIVLMLSFWFFLPGMVYHRAATFKDHFTMEFEEEGFSVGNERGSRTWPWKALSNYMESPNFFFLYFDSRSFFLVPKNGFPGTEAIYAVRQLIRQKVKKKKL